MKTNSGRIIAVVIAIKATANYIVTQTNGFCISAAVLMINRFIFLQFT